MMYKISPFGVSDIFEDEDDRLWSFGRLFTDIIEANPAKFQGLSLKGNKQASDCSVINQGQQIEFSKSITTLGICIDENLTFDEHVNNICLKASRQISALQRLTGLLDMPSRKAIYNSFIVSNCNYCPLVYYSTSRESMNKMQKIQERTLRFELKDSVSDYNTLLTKCGIDSFRKSSLKSMAVEIYRILNDMSPEYLSFFPNLQFRILCEIIINWSNKKWERPPLE